MSYWVGYLLLVMFGCLFNNFSEANECKIDLGQLADAQSKFVDCTVHNAVPVTSCIKCVKDYHIMVDKYDKLLQNCSSVYIDQNRLNIVYSMNKYLTEMWNKAFCYDCFYNSSPSNSTLKFQNLTTTFNNCLNTHKNRDEKCEHCKWDYSSLNDFYKDMDKEKDGKICFDIQDAMNRTRSTWSKELKCCHREYSLLLFLIGSVLFGGLPIVFYLSMYGYTKRWERNHEVLDATFVSGNQATVASTSTGMSSTTLPNLPIQNPINSRPENIDDIKKQIKKQRPSTSTSNSPPQNIGDITEQQGPITSTLQNENKPLIDLI